MTVYAEIGHLSAKFILRYKLKRRVLANIEESLEERSRKTHLLRISWCRDSLVGVRLVLSVAVGASAMLVQC